MVSSAHPRQSVVVRRSGDRGQRVSAGDAFGARSAMACWRVARSNAPCVSQSAGALRRPLLCSAAMPYVHESNDSGRRRGETNGDPG